MDLVSEGCKIPKLGEINDALQNSVVEIGVTL